MAIVLILSTPIRSGWSADPIAATQLLTAVALFEPIMMVLHELSHAIVGGGVGLRVFGVQLGTGPAIVRFWLRDFFITFHLIPAGGACYSAPTKVEGIRWRRIMLVAAGPALHAFVLSVLVGCFWARRDFSFAGRTLTGCVSALTVLNLLMLVRNLWPHDILRDGRKIANDGKTLLELFKSKIHPDAWRELRNLWEIDLCLEKGRIAEARSWLEKLRADCKQPLLAQISELNVLGADNHWPEARAKALAWRSDVANPLQKSAISAWAAVALVYEGGNLNEAQSLCDESVAVVPWEPSTQSVQALVSMAHGRNDEAETFLRKAGSGTNWATRVAAAHMWAEIYRRKGDTGRQRRWEAKARSMDATGAFRVPQTVAATPTT